MYDIRFQTNDLVSIVKPPKSYVPPAGNNYTAALETAAPLIIAHKASAVCM